MISTLFDIISKIVSTNDDKKQTKDSIVYQMIQSFSAIPNFKHIFLTERTNNRFGSMDGVRSILSFTILLIHGHMLALFPQSWNGSQFIYNIMISLKYIHIKNLNIIETFFFMAGMSSNLFSYKWLLFLDFYQKEYLSVM